MTVSTDTLAPKDFTVLTIAAGVVTATQMLHTIAAESGAADDLDTITAGHSNLSCVGLTFRPIVILRADTGDTITIKHGTGNVLFGNSADFELSGNIVLSLIYNGTNWNDINSSASTATPGRVLIGAVDVGAGLAASMAISSIPGTYKSLKYMISAKHDGTVARNADLYFNADTTAANYNSQHLVGTNATASATEIIGTTGAIRHQNMLADTTNDDANAFGLIEGTIIDYASTDKNKLVYASGGVGKSGASGELLVVNLVGYWESAAAITTITVVCSGGDNFAQHSTFYLWGVK